MKEIIDNFWNWYHSLNLGEVIDWIITIGVPTLVAFLIKRGNVAQIKEVKAIAENKQISKTFIDTTNGILDKFADFEKKIKEQAQANERLNSMLMILLANANIPANAKQQAIDLYKKGQVEVVEKIEYVEVISQQNLNAVENQVQEELKQEEKPSELDKLVASFKA